MFDRITTALVGLGCAVVGMLIGWYLKELSRARKEQADKYQEALLGVQSTLERALAFCREHGDSHDRYDNALNRESYYAYLMSLGRLEPYADRVGRNNFEALQELLRGEMGPYSMIPTLQHGIKIVNGLLSKARVF